MDNNGMIEYKENFIIKIKNFFKKLFGKDEQQYASMKKVSIESLDKLDKEEKQDKFINEIKVDTKEIENVLKQDNLLKELNGNVEALNMLSIDRLRILEKYYDEVIKRNNTIIKNLKKSA